MTIEKAINEAKNSEPVTTCDMCNLKDHLDWDCSLFFPADNPCPHKAVMIENDKMRNELQVLRYKK